MDEFFTWDMLATFAGCSAATAILTQFLKNLFVKLPTQWLSYIIAVIILYLATLFTGGMSGAAAAIIPLNAVLVSLASNGAYSAVIRAKDGKPIRTVNIRPAVSNSTANPSAAAPKTEETGGTDEKKQ